MAKPGSGPGGPGSFKTFPKAPGAGISFPTEGSQIKFTDSTGRNLEWAVEKNDYPRKQVKLVLFQDGKRIEKWVNAKDYEKAIRDYTNNILLKDPTSPLFPTPATPVTKKTRERKPVDIFKKQLKTISAEIDSIHENLKTETDPDKKTKLENRKELLTRHLDLVDDQIEKEEALAKINGLDIEIKKAEIEGRKADKVRLETQKSKILKKIEKFDSRIDYYVAHEEYDAAVELGDKEKIKESKQKIEDTLKRGREVGALQEAPLTTEEIKFKEIEDKLEEIKKKRDEADLAGDTIEMNKQNMAESRVYVEKQLLEVASAKTELENAFNESGDVNEKKEIKKIIAVLEDRKKQLNVMGKLLEKQAEAFTRLHNPSNMPDETRLYQNEFAGISKTIDIESQATLAKKLEFEIANAKRSGISKEELEKITKRYENSKNFSELGRSNLQIREGLISLASQHASETDQTKKIQIGDILEPGTKALEAYLGKEACLRRIVDLEDERQATTDTDKIKALNLEEKNLREQITKYETIAKVHDTQERLAEAIARGDTPEKIQAFSIEAETLLREAKASGLIENVREKLQQAEKTAVFEKARTMGISEKDIEKIPQFGKLSFGEQLLALDQLKQFMASKVFEDTEAIYNKRTSEVGGLKRFWRGIWKEYYMGKAEKIALEQNKNATWNEKSEHLSLITNQIYKMDTPVNVNPDGSYTIEYLKIPKTASPEEQQLYGNFNQIAMEFTKMPYEWGLNTAKKSEIKIYQETQKKYIETKERLLLEMEGRLGRKMAFAELANIDANMQMMQFNNSHPDINTIWGLMESNNTKKIAWGTAQAKFWRVSYFGAGWALKNVARAGLVGFMGTFGAITIAGIWGGLRAEKRATKAVQNQDKLSRGGFKNTEQKLILQIKSEKNKQKRDELLKTLQEYRKKGFIKKITLNNVSLEEAKRTTFIDANTWAKNLENLQKKINEEQDPVNKQKLLDKLTVRIRYVNDRIGDGLVNFGALKETSIENNKTVRQTRIGNQYNLMSQIASATMLVTAYDNDIEGAMRKSFDSFMRDSGNKELLNRLGGIESRGEKKINKYIRNKTLRGIIFAEGAMVAGMTMRDLYDGFFPEGSDHPTIPGEEEHTNPTIPEPAPDTHIYKDIGDVQFSSSGGIQTVVDMKHKLIEAYHDEIASGQTDKIPPAYLKVIEGDPTELAKEFDWYRPDQINESVNMLKGSKIEFNDGEINSNSIYNINHQMETESLLEKDGSLGADTEKGFGAEDNERYFHYENGDEGSGGYIIKEEDIQPSTKPGRIIDEEDIQPLQTHGTNHIDYEKQNPDDLLKQNKVENTGSKTGEKAPKIKSPGPNGPSNPQILNPRYPNGGYPLNPGVRTYNPWNLFGSNFSPSEKTLDVLGQLDAHEVLEDPSQYGSTGNMGEAIAYVKKASEELGLDPYRSSLYGDEKMEDYLDRLAEAKLEQTA